MAKQDKIDALRTAVEKQNSLNAAVLELLKGVKTAVADAREADDEQELDEILAKLDGPAAQELAAAVAASTPAAPLADATPQDVPVEDVQAVVDEAGGASPTPAAPEGGGQPA